MADDPLDTTGDVSVEVVPDARNWARKLREQIRDYTVRPKVEPDFDPASQEKFREKGKTSGDKFAGEFERTVQAKIRAAIASLPDVSVGADMSDAQRSLEALRTELETLSTDIGVNVSDDAALAEIAKIRAELASLAADNPDIRINVDALAAEAKLAEVSVAIDKLNGKEANVKVKTDQASSRSTTSFLSFVDSHLHTLPALAVAGTAAMIPLAGALGGIVAALGAPLVIAGGAATLYGFLAGAAIKQTEAQKKKIDQLKTAVDSAKQSLANTEASAATSASNALASANASAATSLASAHASAEASLKSARQAEAAATTAASRASARRRVAAAEAALASRQSSVHASLSARQQSIAASQAASVAAAQRKVNDATKAYRDALKGLSPEQTKFLDAQEGFKDEFKKLVTTEGPALLGPATQFLGILTTVLPAATPLLDAVSGALTRLLGDLDRAGQGKALDHVIDTIARLAGRDIVIAGHIAGNLAQGIGELFLAIDRKGSGGGMLKDVESLTANFSDWAGSKDARHDVQRFFDYFHKVGPQVGDTIGAVARGIGHIVKALAPLGPPALHAVEGISDALSKIPVPVLTALAAAFVAITAAAKVGKGVSSLTSGLGGLGLGGGKGGALASLFGSKGATPANPLYVFTVNGGGGVPGVVTKGPKGILAAAEGGGEAGLFGNLFGKGALSRILGAAISAPALITLGDAGNEVRTLTPRTPSQEEFQKKFAGVDSLRDIAPAGHSVADVLKIYNLTKGQARGLLDLGNLKASSTALDALRANLATASRQIDLVGPRADRAFGDASKDISAFVDKMSTIRDRKFKIIAETADAIRSMEALQAYRFRDKRIGIEIDRIVGPGGGIGHPLPNARHGSGGGSGGGSGNGSSGPTYTGDINITASDHKDFQLQMMNRHRRAALDGVN